MNQIIIFILGLALGFGLAKVFKRIQPGVGGAGQGVATINQKRRGEKEQAKAKIIGMLGERAEISNDQVQTALGVSDATATNYLQELEAEGRLEQVGREGRFVRYRLKN